MFGARESSGYPIFGLFYIVLTLGVVGYVLYINKKRRQEIIDFCKKNGMTFQDKVISFPAEVRNFSFINIGDERDFSCIMSVSKQNKKIYIFDLWAKSYIDKGKYHTAKERSYRNGGTVCLIIQNTGIKKDVPSFFLTENKTHTFTSIENNCKNIYPDYLYDAHGGIDVNIENNPEFAEKFILKGLSEESVRNTFTPELINSFLSKHKDGYNYEAGSKSLMVFNQMCLSLPERLNMLKLSLDLFEDIYSK